MIDRFLPDPARVKNLLNRLVLAARFFSATRTKLSIANVEFDFAYVDGERSPQAKRITGVFEPDVEQPDVLMCVPRSCAIVAMMGSHQRRSLVLGRQDAKAKRTRKTDDEILAALGVSPLVPHSLRGIVRRAYDAAFDSFPAWAPPEALAPMRARPAE